MVSMTSTTCIGHLLNKKNCNHTTIAMAEITSTTYLKHSQTVTVPEEWFNKLKCDEKRNRKP
jgi:hypothetical protein